MLRLGIKSPSQSPAERMNQRYDHETFEVMRRSMGDNGIGIDGGAHKGLFLSEMCNITPGVPHLAFEPIPALAAMLRKRFPDQRIRQCALGEQAGTAPFCHVVNDPGYSGLRPRTYDRPDPQIETIDVEVVRLDDIIGDESPAFIKLDLEGGEYHALLGAVETMRRCSPVVVFEAGDRSCGHYDVTAAMFHELFTGRLGYGVSTMRDWLQGGTGLNRSAFIDAYAEEFCFMAFPE